MRTRSFLWVLMMLPVWGVVQAQETERVMLVLDASGSMWGRIGNEPKISIAKRSVRSLVKGWASAGNLEAGLIVYGHRRKGDCDDIETLIPPQRLDADAFAGRVDALSPKGKTPLSRAVTQAAESLAFGERKATVILVSDGIETCGLDPCAVGAELETKGVDFTTHVIGFDIAGEQDRQQLQCLAEKTGGVFTTASNEEELTAALSTLGDFEAELLVPPVVEAGFHFDVAWNGPNAGADGVTVVPVGAPASDLTVWVQHNGSNPVRLRAPSEPGEYVVRYVVHPYKDAMRQVAAEEPIRVVPMRPAFSAPEVVKANAWMEINWRGPEAGGDGFAIAEPGSADSERVRWKQHSGKNPVRIRAPKEPGAYEIRYVIHPYNTRKRRVVARRMLTVE